MSDSVPPSVNRRVQHRVQVWLPVQGDGLAGGVAVTHDLSSNGVLLSAAGPVAVGSTVTLKLTVPPEGGREMTALGRVVRVEPNPDDPDGLWRHRIAVAFDTSHEELVAAVTRLGLVAPAEP